MNEEKAIAPSGTAKRKNGANRRRRTNRTGTLEKRGAKWLARWYEKLPNGKVKRKSKLLEVSSLEEARKILRETVEPVALEKAKEKRERELKELEGVKAEIREWNDKQPALAITDAWEVFDSDYASCKRDPATQENYGQWFRHFSSWIANNHPEVTELRRVDSAIAREYANALLPTVRGTTFNRHLNALALIWSTLAAQDVEGKPLYPNAKLGANPFGWNRQTKAGIPRVTLKREERPHRRRVLNLDELARIMELAEGEMRVLIALGFYTGLRLGDCATLEWDNIDRVNHIITTRSHKTDTETTPRIHPKLAEIIQENVETTSGYLLPTMAELYNGGTNGRVKLSRMISDLFTSAGIKTSYKGEGETRARPDCGFHSLRHTYVTQLERVGATLAERQLLAGHRTAAMTEHYTHGDASRVLALPDITKGGEVVDDGEGRLQAFRSAWDALTDEEKEQAKAYMMGNPKERSE